MDAWRADSRTAACACLLLLCAVRETLGRRGDCLALAGALCDICAGLARGNNGKPGGGDGMAWGCDLDPGAAQSGSQHRGGEGGTPYPRTIPLPLEHACMHAMKPGRISDGLCEH